jgi:hypothetical protein
MQLPLGDVRKRAARGGLDLPAEAVASAVAALNTGAHLALLPTNKALERASSFASVLVATAAEAGVCIGSLDLYEAAAALIPLRQLVHERFLTDLWLILTAPAPAAISRVVDEARDVWHDSDARLLVVTTRADLRDAALAPAAKRRLIPIRV